MCNFVFISCEDAGEVTLHVKNEAAGVDVYAFCVNAAEVVATCEQYNITAEDEVYASSELEFNCEAQAMLDKARETLGFA